MAERAFLYNSSARQAALDRFCHETRAPSQSPVAVILLQNHDEGDEKKGKKKKKRQ